jgi:hypothetical protein
MAQRQHYVPEFYLRHFIDPASATDRHPTLFVVDLEHLTVTRRQPHNVAVICGFYDWEQLAGQAQPLESLYGDVESEAAPVLQRLATGDCSLDFHERYTVAKFLGFQLSRTPHVRNVVHASFSEQAMEYIERIANDDRELRRRLQRGYSGDIEPMASEIKEFVQERKFTVSTTKDVVLRTTVAFALEFIPRICDMSWEFVVSKGDREFFTSDHPVNILTRGGQAPDLPPRGMDVSQLLEAFFRQVEIFFAASPSCGLVLRNYGTRDGRLWLPRKRGDTEYVGCINTHVLPAVRKYLFCSSEGLAGWAIKHRSKAGR